MSINNLDDLLVSGNLFAAKIRRFDWRNLKVDGHPASVTDQVDYPIESQCRQRALCLSRVSQHSRVLETAGFPPDSRSMAGKFISETRSSSIGTTSIVAA